MYVILLAVHMVTARLQLQRGSDMALDANALENMIKAELEAEGFVLAGAHAGAGKLATAIAKAVVEHMTQAAEVPVSGGSSAGIYKVT